MGRNEGLSGAFDCWAKAENVDLFSDRNWGSWDTGVQGIGTESYASL